MLLFLEKILISGFAIFETGSDQIRLANDWSRVHRMLLRADTFAKLPLCMLQISLLPITARKGG
jgi:hypothetical protein